MTKRTQFFQNCLGVFQGGGCRAAAYVGAYKEAVARGVSFSEVVGTSAGSIIAVLIGAGASPVQLEEMIHRLDFKTLAKAPDVKAANKLSLTSRLVLSCSSYKDFQPVLTDLGFHSSTGIQGWIEEELHRLLPGAPTPVKFKHLKVPTSVVTTDLVTQKIKVWGTELTPDDDVAFAVRTSCSIPIFFQPVDNRYVDGGVLSNLPSFAFSDDFHNKVLAFSVVSNESKPEIKCIFSYLTALANSVVDGAQDLQLSLQKNVHIIPIPSGDVKSTDFKSLTAESVDFLIRSGESSMGNFIDNEIINLKQAKVNTNICHSHAQTYYSISRTVNVAVSDVIIADISTDWVYDLYLTLLSWIQNGASVTVVLKDGSDNKTHGPLRIRILESLGINVIFVDEIPVRCFLINSNSQESGLAIVRRHPSILSDDVDAIIYESPTDNQVIRCLHQTFQEYIPKANIGEKLPILASVEYSVAISALAKVNQYKDHDVNIYVAEININDIVMLTNFVRGYKYRQICHLFNLYHIHGKHIFKPCAIVYPNGKQTLVGMPVLEKHGKRYYLIDGNTRITYCHRHGIESIYVLVVDGVAHPLPATGYYSPSEVIVTDKVVSGASRYDNFDKKNYRYIDAAFRDPASCLL